MSQGLQAILRLHYKEISKKLNSDSLSPLFMSFLSVAIFFPLHQFRTEDFDQRKQKHGHFQKF